nr:T9SS type A sorting domain-containing protein [Flavipsychrobacter sp.]
YRLKLTDIDGSVSFSKTIELNRKGSEFTLYPNPCTNEISLLSAELELQTTYEIIDMMGVKLKNEYLLNNNRSIQVSDLKPGTYILRLKNANTLNVLTFVKN